jgi:hypothetical protein
MKNSKYVLATIYLPIEVTPEGKQITHKELYNIKFSVLDFLPPKPAFVKTEISISELFPQIKEKPQDVLQFRENTPTDTICDSDDESENHSENESDDTNSLVSYNFENDSSTHDIVSDKPAFQFKKEPPKMRIKSKSKTFRRIQTASRRFSRRSDTRIVHIPQYFIDTLSSDNV